MIEYNGQLNYLDNSQQQSHQQQLQQQNSNVTVLCFTKSNNVSVHESIDTTAIQNETTEEEFEKMTPIVAKLTNIRHPKYVNIFSFSVVAGFWSYCSTTTTSCLTLNFRIPCFTFTSLISSKCFLWVAVWFFVRAA